MVASADSTAVVDSLLAVVADTVAADTQDGVATVVGTACWVADRVVVHKVAVVVVADAL